MLKQVQHDTVLRGRYGGGAGNKIEEHRLNTVPAPEVLQSKTSIPHRFTITPAGWVAEKTAANEVSEDFGAQGGAPPSSTIENPEFMIYNFTWVRTTVL